MRSKNQLIYVENNPSPYYTIKWDKSLTSMREPKQFEVKLLGAQDTPYKDGIFELSIGIIPFTWSQLPFII